MNTAWGRARLKRPDDVTTAESNPVGFRFAIPNIDSPIESIIPSSTLLTEAKEYLSRVAVRVETDAEKWNLGQMCHPLVCRRTEPVESTIPLISLELSDTES